MTAKAFKLAHGKVGATETVPQYTYLKPQDCWAETRRDAYYACVTQLERGKEYRIEERVKNGAITFIAFPLEEEEKT